MNQNASSKTSSCKVFTATGSRQSSASDDLIEAIAWRTSSKARRSTKSRKIRIRPTSSITWSNSGSSRLDPLSTDPDEVLPDHARPLTSGWCLPGSDASIRRDTTRCGPSPASELGIKPTSPATRCFANIGFALDIHGERRPQARGGLRGPQRDHPREHRAPSTGRAKEAAREHPRHRGSHPRRSQTKDRRDATARTVERELKHRNRTEPPDTKEPLTQKPTPTPTPTNALRKLPQAYINLTAARDRGHAVPGVQRIHDSARAAKCCESRRAIEKIVGHTSRVHVPIHNIRGRSREFDQATRWIG